MASRSTLADLITRVRRLIQDPAGDSQTWEDEEIQEYLDARRDDMRYLELTAAKTVQPGGAVVVLDYYAPRGNWETDAVIYDPTFTPIPAASGDYQTGHWTLAANQYPPVFLTGKAYDLYATAADLLELWASRVKLEFDFQTADQQRFSRSQQVRALLDLAATYRAKQRPTLARIIRSDVC